MKSLSNKLIMIGMVLVGTCLTACEPVNHQSTVITYQPLNLSYFKDQFGICYAYAKYDRSASIATVDCDKAHLNDSQPVTK